MRDTLTEIDPTALAGLTSALSAVDVILKSLLEEIQIRVDAADKIAKAPSLDSTAPLASLIRLVIQKQTIETLRRGIPAAILYGDVTKLRGAVG